MDGGTGHRPGADDTEVWDFICKKNSPELFPIREMIFGVILVLRSVLRFCPS